MLINSNNIKDLFTGFNTSFNEGTKTAESFYNDISMTVPSNSRETNYAWLGQFPSLREWVGDRVIRNISAHSYVIKNKLYENTISVDRKDIEDDQYGVLSPLFEEMGRITKEHPDELVFKLLTNGFAELCYDGQPFFDADHPVRDEDGNDMSISNTQAGASAPWFMLDCRRAIKPVIFQERIPYSFAALDKETDENVFFKDEYIYGVRARANAGFGLWQLAYGSKATLDFTNFVNARTAMRSMKGDEGRPLGIRPTHLVVPPSLEGAARQILENETRVEEVGGSLTNISNEWKGTMKLIVSEWL